MTLFLGADSSTPQPALYAGHEVWGWYIAGDTPHVWTQAEVRELSAHGVNRTLPIAVPPQGENWWALNEGYAALDLLCRRAQQWGLPGNSPLVLDVEESQAVQLGANTAHAWAVACEAHHYIPWLYSSQTFLDKDQWCNKWLASWLGPAGTDHAAPTVMPARMLGWQYAGDVEGGRIDRDIFESGHNYLDPRAIGATMSGEAAFGTPVPPSVPEAAPAPAPAPEVEIPTEDATEPTEEVAAPAPVVDVPTQEIEAALQQARDEATAAEQARLKAALYAHVDSFFA